MKQGSDGWRQFTNNWPKVAIITPAGMAGVKISFQSGFSRWLSKER